MLRIAHPSLVAENRFLASLNWLSCQYSVTLAKAVLEASFDSWLATTVLEMMAEHSFLVPWVNNPGCHVKFGRGQPFRYLSSWPLTPCDGVDVCRE